MPKATARGATASWPGREVPVPVDATERVGFDALELIARLPVTLPAD